MSYLSLARKYRPRNFDEIIGQGHIVTTLKNAIGMNRVAHAYLFAGPRGVGKTSTARILAKSLNCQEGPTPKPCDKCTSCNEISKGISMDCSPSAEVGEFGSRLEVIPQDIKKGWRGLIKVF